jgi:hypothetical protein
MTVSKYFILSPFVDVFFGLISLLWGGSNRRSMRWFDHEGGVYRKDSGVSIAENMINVL